MKRSLWTRVLAVVLVISMLATPVSAASRYGNNNRGGWGWGWGWDSFWDYWFGGSDEEEETEPVQTESAQTEPAQTEPVETEPAQTEDGSDTVLTLVEDASTVDNGEVLRASTYALTRDASATTTTTKVVYFPVTMYNYDTDALNDATHALDGDTVYRGMYFTGGSPEYTKSTDADMSAFVAGQYYIQNIRASENNANSWISYFVSDDGMAMVRAKSKADATLWTLEVEDGSFYLSTTVDGTKLYLTMSEYGADGDSFTTEKTAIAISAYSGDDAGVQLSTGEYYLCQWGSDTAVYYGSYDVNNDGGNGMLFYPVDSDEPIAPGEGVTKIVSGYEEWNRWDKAAGSNANGDLIYTGLVQDTMVDDQIVFNVPEGGIFNSVTSVKNIYEYVGLPFVLKEYTNENNDEGKLGLYYSFDSDANGAYFEGTPQSGSIDEFGNVTAHNLHFAEGAPQPMPSGLSVGDGSTNAFFPYNNQSSYATADVDYHFGMRADLPFSMTPNGRVKSTDDESAPITFTFSGDDDVWVFIDGHLVIDLGGIHNRLDATIDFANNTITYSEENKQDDDKSTASYNDSSFAMVQQLFTADGDEGVIPMSLDAFALDPDHEMQVFYLERGEGTSNCRIEFNLPMNDTVLVTKDATQSWSQAAEDADLALDPDDENAGVDQLTATEQAIVNNIDFGFTLYKKTAEEDAVFEPVANTNFYLIGRGIEGTVINQTDANGHFYLKNGQSAKFITEIPSDGVTYYVVEDKVPDGFVAPDFNFAGEATYDYAYTDGTTTGTAPAADASGIPEQIIPLPTENEDGSLTWAENKSYEVTVKGSVEANDSIEFICSNYLDAELPNPTALTYEDIIVIDYGLPVNIDPLANDVFRGDDIEIIAFGGANMKLGEIVDKDGDKVFEESELDITRDDGNFHSGAVVLNDKIYSVDDKGNVTRDTFTYTLNKQLTEVEVITYIIKVTGQEKQEATEETLTQYDYAIGKVYIVPATTMYYEENFSDLVTFKSGNGLWDANATTDLSAVSANQEPGVVGTVGDSTYGSDVAYLSDSGDSNGTSRHGDTTNGAIQFTYTFTGTGTSFFARTSATTGYMQVKIYEGTEIISDALLDLTYRDTYYEDANGSDEDSTGTLYNIPVYTQEDLPYGTYTVVATIAKAGTKGAGEVGNDGYQHSGKDFYLDGIRIVQPLNEDAENIELTEKALGAYATDGEANVDIVTLRYKLITDAETEDNWNFVVLTDTNGEVKTAEEYTSIGPKEEVYLLPGQSVSFAIKYWHKDGYLLHLGMKAPFGTASAQVGQTTFDLKNATDCYYNITGMQSRIVTETAEDGSSYYVATYTISATDSIVSLTNLKVTGNYEFVLIEDVDIDVNGSDGEGTDGEGGDTDGEVTE